MSVKNGSKRLEQLVGGGKRQGNAVHQSKTSLRRRRSRACLRAPWPTRARAHAQRGRAARRHAPLACTCAPARTPAHAHAHARPRATALMFANPHTARPPARRARPPAPPSAERGRASASIAAEGNEGVGSSAPASCGASGARALRFFSGRPAFAAWGASGGRRGAPARTRACASGGARQRSSLTARASDSRAADAGSPRATAGPQLARTASCAGIAA